MTSDIIILLIVFVIMIFLLNHEKITSPKKRKVTMFLNRLAEIKNSMQVNFPSAVETEPEVLEEIEFDSNTPDSEVAQIDDLTVIEGIGPKIEQLLYDAGITSYQDLSQVSIDQLQQILNEGGNQFNMANPKIWPEQAKMAEAGLWDDLEQYQNELYGGL